MIKTIQPVQEEGRTTKIMINVKDSFFLTFLDLYHFGLNSSARPRSE